MKTLDEIKNEIAQEIGYESADNYLSELYEIGSIYTIDRINLFINEIAIRTAKEALKNASENATYILDANDEVHIVKSSITSEENIPTL